MSQKGKLVVKHKFKKNLRTNFFLLRIVRLFLKDIQVVWKIMKIRPFFLEMFNIQPNQHMSNIFLSKLANSLFPQKHALFLDDFSSLENTVSLKNDQILKIEIKTSVFKI